jgi:V/A-type H+-transporting ATPase subunit I
MESGKELQELDRKLAAEQHTWAPFGNVRLDTLAALQGSGLQVQFLRTSERPENAPADAAWIPATPGFSVLVSPEPVEESTAIPLPVRGPQVLSTRRAHIAKILSAQDEALAAMATRLPELEAYALQLEEDLEYRQAHAGMEEADVLAWISGFVPADRIPDITDEVEQWGVALHEREPSEDDPTPTLLKQSAFVSWIQPVFSFLGVTPGYNEVDVGWSFLVFLSVFSGMIIGDAGYGLLLIAVVGALNLLNPHTRGKFSNLLLLMGGATTLWGFLTGNLFGISGIPAIFPSLAATSDPKSIMNVCFLLGASHLTLAHLWNLWRNRTSLQALAELGWIGSTWTMYGVTGQMVLGWDSVPSFLMPVFLVSVLLIVLFMTPPAKFREKWVDHMMLPLSFVNNFVDVVSYVRLYAVGMATFALASSFNQMIFPEGTERHILMTGVMAVILVLGHALNFILAGMGVMVHGIRLNTLEFASHLGLTWSGIPYSPFRKKR